VTWTTRPRAALSAILAYVRSEAAWLGAFALIAGAVLSFVGIAEEMTEGDVRAFDMAVLNVLQPEPGKPIGPGWFHYAAQDFTSLGSVSVLATISLVVIGFLLIRRRWLEAGLLALAAGGGLLISQVLKGVFGRERPPDIYRTVDAINTSFPSGHALLSAVIYLSLGALLARSTKHKTIRAYIIVVAILVALMVGFTRIYLGVHWASDVLAGWCAGAAWASACWLLDRWLAHRTPDAPKSD
jgi:undecaprenyl-diphosphatase